MSAVEKNFVQGPHPDVRLVCEDDSVYAFFGSTLHRQDSIIGALGGLQRYTHGYIASKPQVIVDEEGKPALSKGGNPLKKPADGGHLARTREVTGHLILENEAPVDVHLLENLIVIPADSTDEVIDMLGKQPVDPHVDVLGLATGWPPSLLPSERLYRSLRAHVVEGVGYTACGTYRETDAGLELTVVNEHGGYSFGVPGMEGLVNDEQLARMSRIALPLVSVE